MFKELEDGFAVSPQISADDVRTAASLGYKTIVSNRPDEEEAGQPSAAEIGEAAQAEGLSFLHVPVAPPQGPTDDAVAAMAAALMTPGKTLAYCRTGTRSTMLWALARAQEGRGADELIGAAKAAGYDLESLRGRLS